MGVIMSSLLTKNCIPCSGSIPPLEDNQKLILLKELSSIWELVDGGKKLRAIVKCSEFSGPMKIANDIAIIADKQWHHPDLHISFGQLGIDLWTHKIDDLVESDFIFAAKIDEVLKSYEI